MAKTKAAPRLGGGLLKKLGEALMPLLVELLKKVLGNLQGGAGPAGAAAAPAFSDAQIREAVEKTLSEDNGA